MNTASTDFPELRDCKRISIDVETRDDDLKKLGPGVRRGGYICGVAVGWTQDGKVHSRYYPIRHEQGDNLDPEKVFRYLRKEVCGSQQEIVGANLLYDLDYLAEEGVHPKGRWLDVQVAEPLIDENKRGSYDLDSLSKHYLGRGKDSESLYEYLASAFGGRPTRSQQAGKIWRAPGKIAEAYACSDVENPLGIIHQQLEKIHKKVGNHSLEEVWHLETDLMPMLLAMRRRGVRIDAVAAATANRKMEARINELREILEKSAIVPTVASTIGDYCDLVGIPYTLTEATRQPSITQAWLEKNSDNEMVAAIAEVRKAEKSSGTFIQGLLKHLTAGNRVHCLFNQLNSDNYGTVSGRFSSSNPNLQNIPARDPTMAALIRGLFVPEDGELWGRADYSQIEYRMLVDYAMKFYRGKKASEAMLNRFKENPDTDMHQEVADLCGISRGEGKTINFGMVYGLGLNSLINKLGYPRNQCKEIIDRYHDKMPFARELYTDAQESAQKSGHIRTLGGRRRRFERWEPVIPWELYVEPKPALVEYMEYDEEEKVWRRNLDKRPRPLPKDQAEKTYPDCKLKRSHCHTALNALLQGSAADIMKRAMVDIWDAGICDVLGAPLLTVHDELNWSVPDTPEGREAFAESNRIMEAVYNDRLKIPLKVDFEIGANWAECK